MCHAHVPLQRTNAAALSRSARDGARKPSPGHLSPARLQNGTRQAGSRPGHGPTHELQLRGSATLCSSWPSTIAVVILDVLLTVWRRRECHIGVFVRRVSGWDVLDWTRSKTRGRMCNFN